MQKIIYLLLVTLCVSCQNTGLFRNREIQKTRSLGNNDLEIVDFKLLDPLCGIKTNIDGNFFFLGLSNVGIGASWNYSGNIKIDNKIKYASFSGFPVLALKDIKTSVYYIFLCVSYDYENYEMLSYNINSQLSNPYRFDNKESLEKFQNIRFVSNSHNYLFQRFILSQYAHISKYNPKLNKELNDSLEIESFINFFCKYAKENYLLFSYTNEDYEENIQELYPYKIEKTEYYNYSFFSKKQQSIVTKDGYTIIFRDYFEYYGIDKLSEEQLNKLEEVYLFFLLKDKKYTFFSLRANDKLKLESLLLKIAEEKYKRKINKILR